MMECLFLTVNGIQRVSVDNVLLTGDEQNSILTLRRLMSYIYMEHPFLMFLDHTQ